MNRTSLTVFVVVAAALAGCSGAPAPGCDAVCAEGCLLSADCTSCLPSSPSAGLGNLCRNDLDCCTGICSPRGACVAGGSAGGSTGGSTGSSGGACTSWRFVPSASYDAACNPAGGSDEVCNPDGVCIGSCCGKAPEYCGLGSVCAASGHCLAPGWGGSSSGGGWGGSSGGGSGGSSGGAAGVCGQTGVASCTGPTGPRDCCSQYCVAGSCHCNTGGGIYPCVSDADCCPDRSRGCGPAGTCL